MQIDTIVFLWNLVSDFFFFFKDPIDGKMNFDIRVVRNEKFCLEWKEYTIYMQLVGTILQFSSEV